MTTDADRLLEQPLPHITTDEAAAVAAGMFGVEGEVEALTGERDRNFRITGPLGDFSLKFGHPAEGSEVLQMQADLLSHLARVDPGLPVPRTRPTIDGAGIAGYIADGVHLPVRMVDFLPGIPLQQAVSTEKLRHNIGAMLARLDRALRGFFHRAAGRTLLWDLSHLDRLRPKLTYVEPTQRALVEEWFDRFDRQVAPHLARLRAQVIHNDFNPDNLLVGPGDPDDITGIIDFGDAVHGALVIDLGVAVAYQVLGSADPAAALADMVGAFHERLPLEPDEADLLPELVAGRLVQSLVVGAWRGDHHPDNAEYILAYQDSTWSTLEKLSEVGSAELRTAARSACGMPAVSKPSTSTLDALLTRRRTRFGPGQRLSYTEPLHVAAAEGSWLIDPAGVRYLDAYNNVPHVGHNHPHVVAAITAQSRLLNTNTRYLVESVVDYADRLVELLPEELSVVYFANSGSEANDLAWRMARTVTGHDGFIITPHAYHGATYLTMATSPEELGLGNLEPWVATVPAPSGDHDPAVSEAVERLGSAGVAALAYDTVFSSDGIYEPPVGYLREAARQVREAGGLFIADEVQGGFGRAGSRMWAFAGQDVVPDIVTLGKPMGNGHPIAAVVTTPNIADTFSKRGYYFSTFAGNPVATAAAQAVLDVLEAEGLPARAERVGEYLRNGLRTLAGTHPILAEIRGPGMFIGVEIRSSEGPDVGAAAAVVDGMRRQRVLIGRTGVDGNVLKIRPPLAFAESHADLLLETLDSVLGELR